VRGGKGENGIETSIKDNESLNINILKDYLF
jgi:hypothetical protein